MSEAKTVKEQAVESFRPVVILLTDKEKSGYFPKDELFTKKKTYINRKQKQKVQETIDADWRKFHVNGKFFYLVKGEEVHIDIVKNLGDKKDYFLVKKTSSPTKTPKEKAEESVAKAEEKLKVAIEKGGEEPTDKQTEAILKAEESVAKAKETLESLG